MCVFDSVAYAERAGGQPDRALRTAWRGGPEGGPARGRRHRGTVLAAEVSMLAHLLARQCYLAHVAHMGGRGSRLMVHCTVAAGQAHRFGGEWRLQRDHPRQEPARGRAVQLRRRRHQGGDATAGSDVQAGSLCREEHLRGAVGRLAAG